MKHQYHIPGHSKKKMKEIQKHPIPTLLMAKLSNEELEKMNKSIDNMVIRNTPCQTNPLKK